MECAGHSTCTLRGLDEIREQQQKQGREITCLCAETERLQFENKHLRFRVTSLEDRLDRLDEDARGHNLLFYGIPRSEGHESAGDCEQKVLVVVHRVLGFQREVPIEEARRVGSAIIARFTHRRDRDSVLSNLQRLKGSKFSVREDVTPTVRRKQRGLLPLYKELRGAGRRASIRGDKLVTEEGIFTYDLDAKRVVKVEMAGLKHVAPAAMDLRHCISKSVFPDFIHRGRSQADGSTSQGHGRLDSVRAEPRVCGRSTMTTHEIASSPRTARNTFSNKSSTSSLDSNCSDTRPINNSTLHDAGSEILTGSFKSGDVNDNHQRKCLSDSESGSLNERSSRGNGVSSIGSDSTNVSRIDSVGSGSTRVMSPVSKAAGVVLRVISPRSDPDSDITKVSALSNADSDATMVMSPLSNQDSDPAMTLMSPRSNPDVTETFAGEMSIDSGLSTLTGSLLSQSLGLGISQGLQGTNQHDDHHFKGNRPPSPASKLIPAADSWRVDAPSSSVNTAAAHLHPDIPYDFHSKHEGSTLICSSPREGMDMSSEDFGDRVDRLEKGNSLGPGWFSYMQDSSQMTKRQLKSVDGSNEHAHYSSSPRTRRLSGVDHDGSVPGGSREERTKSPSRKSGIPVFQSHSNVRVPDPSVEGKPMVVITQDNFPPNSVCEENGFSEHHEAASAYKIPTADMFHDGAVVGLVHDSPPKGQVIEFLHDTCNEGLTLDESTTGKTCEHFALRDSIADVSYRGEAVKENYNEGRYEECSGAGIPYEDKGENFPYRSSEGKLRECSREATPASTHRGVSSTEHSGDHSYTNSENVFGHVGGEWTEENLGEEKSNKSYRERGRPQSARGVRPREQRLCVTSGERRVRASSCSREQTARTTSVEGKVQDSYYPREQRLCLTSREENLYGSTRENHVQGNTGEARVCGNEVRYEECSGAGIPCEDRGVNFPYRSSEGNLRECSREGTPASTHRGVSPTEHSGDHWYASIEKRNAFGGEWTEENLGEEKSNKSYRERGRPQSARGVRPREQRLCVTSGERRVRASSCSREQTVRTTSVEGKMQDSYYPREQRLCLTSREENFYGSTREKHVQGNTGEARVCGNGRRRSLDSPSTERIPDGPRGGIVNGSTREQFISNPNKMTPDTRTVEGGRVPQSPRGQNSIRGHDNSNNKDMRIRDVFGLVCDIGSNKSSNRSLSRSKSAREADRKNVGWHRSGGQWQYCHKRAMADDGQHPANQGALLLSDLTTAALEGEVSSPVSVNGLEATNGEGDAREQEQDHISQKLNDMQDSILLPIKEDLSEWVTRIIGVEISPETFVEVLDSGVVLCTLAKLIEKHAQQYAKEGKLSEPLPTYKLKCNNNAKSGTWFSRDNVTNFLGWCRAYGMTDETMFDSEDLVSHRQEKPVVNCVLELARLGWKYGIEPPNLIRMEREIEKEAKEFEPPPFVPKPVEIVKEKPVEVPVEVKKPPEKLNLDKEVKRLAHKCKCQEYVNRISEGVYDVFGKRVFIRLLHGKHLMVRVGGGWDTFENYLRHHDPIHVYEFHRDERRPNKKDNFEGYLVIKSKYKSS